MKRRDTAPMPAQAQAQAQAPATADLAAGPLRPGRRALALAGAALAATATAVRAESPAPDARVAPRPPDGSARRASRWLLHRDDR